MKVSETKEASLIAEAITPPAASDKFKLTRVFIAR